MGGNKEAMFIGVQDEQGTIGVGYFNMTKGWGIDLVLNSSTCFLLYQPFMLCIFVHSDTKLGINIPDINY